MTSVEQRKMVQRLKQKMAKMSFDERQSFEMMLKRDRDDEEFDSLTMAKLKQLLSKFFPKNTKEALEDKWKKLTGVE
jgi:tagatose-1,6-bisphosphate aldolase